MNGLMVAGIVVVVIGVLVLLAIFARGGGEGVLAIPIVIIVIGALLLVVGYEEADHAQEAQRSAHVELQLRAAGLKLKSMEVVENGKIVIYQAGSEDVSVTCEAHIGFTNGKPVFKLAQNSYEPSQLPVCLKELEAATKAS